MVQIIVARASASIVATLNGQGSWTIDEITKELVGIDETLGQHEIRLLHGLTELLPGIPVSSLAEAGALHVLMVVMPGRKVLTSSHDATSKLWSADTGRLMRTFVGHREVVHSSSFSSDGTLAVTCSRDGTAKVWCAKTGDCLLTVGDPALEVLHAAWSPDGTRLLASMSNSEVHIWEVTDGRHVQTLCPPGHSSENEYTRCALFSSSGRTVVAMSSSNAVSVFVADTGAVVQSVEGDPNDFRSMDLSANGEIVAINSLIDDWTKVISVVTGECLHEFRDDTGMIPPVFSPDGRLLLTGAGDDAVAIWDLGSGGRQHVLSRPGEDVVCAQFSPDCSLVVIATNSGDATAWAVESGLCLYILEGHRCYLTTLAFSDDGQLLLTSCADGTCRVWCARTGECFHALEGHDSSCTVASFSPGTTR